MKVEQLLQHHAIGETPFGQEDASTDQVFKQHCLERTHHPAWDKIYSDPEHPTTSVVFAIWSVLASSSDTFLKPVLLARGLDLPMVVIFMGAIGGFIMSGFIGLFVGAVILALGYKLFMAWIEESRTPDRAKP